MLLEFLVGKEIFVSAPVVEDAGGTSGIVLKGVAEFADDVPRR